MLSLFATRIGPQVNADREISIADIEQMAHEFCISGQREAWLADADPMLAKVCVLLIACACFLWKFLSHVGFEGY